jgi:hypothetical protein
VGPTASLCRSVQQLRRHGAGAGTYTLYAKIDEPNTNAEYCENNNLNRVRVIISGSCS